jgi:hypothetical protein
LPDHEIEAMKAVHEVPAMRLDITRAMLKPDRLGPISGTAKNRTKKEILFGWAVATSSM